MAYGNSTPIYVPQSFTITRNGTGNYMTASWSVPSQVTATNTTVAPATHTSVNWTFYNTSNKAIYSNSTYLTIGTKSCKIAFPTDVVNGKVKVASVKVIARFKNAKGVSKWSASAQPKFTVPNEPQVSASYDYTSNQVTLKLTAGATAQWGPRLGYQLLITKSQYINGVASSTTNLINGSVLGWDSNSTTTYSKTSTVTPAISKEDDYVLYRIQATALGVYGNRGLAYQNIYIAYPDKPYFRSQTKTSSGTNVIVNCYNSEKRPTEKIQLQINYADKEGNLSNDWTDIGSEYSIASVKTEAQFSIFLDDAKINPTVGQHVFIRAKATAQGRTVYSNNYMLDDRYYYQSESGDEDEDASAIQITNVDYGGDSESLEVTIGYANSAKPAYNACELSYSSDVRAWQATKQPETYEMKDTYWQDATSQSSSHACSSSISILGLESDTTYYLRARRYVISDKDNQHTRWSQKVKHSTSEDELTGLVLNTSDLGAVNQPVSFSWEFPEGLKQTSWFLYDATNNRSIKNGAGTVTSCEYTYTSSGSKKVYLITKFDDGRSMKSDVVSINVEPKPVLTFATSPQDIVTALPLTFAISSSVAQSNIQVKILSFGIANYLPAGGVRQYLNDVVWSAQGVGDSITCSVDDGSALWNNGMYQIQAVATSNGIKSDVLTRNFNVLYTKTVTPPELDDVVITPTDDKGATITVNNLSSDVTWSLYRCSKDTRNALIAQNLESGATVTDRFAPYSTGEKCEYIVLVENEQKQTDYGYYEYSANYGVLRFDWSENFVELPYNIEISDETDKQFEQQVYLDGTQKGAWGASVVRKATLKTDTIYIKDEETQKKVRELARYQDAVFVRTPLGQAYTANVEVTDITKSYESKAMAVTFECTEIDLTQDFMATTEEG